MNEQYSGENSLVECAMCCEESSLLEAIKSFTEHTGADVTISNGTYAVFWNDSCYDACCEDSLTDIMDAVTTLYMADF